MLPKIENSSNINEQIKNEKGNRIIINKLNNEINSVIKSKDKDQNLNIKNSSFFDKGILSKNEIQNVKQSNSINFNNSKNGENIKMRSFYNNGFSTNTNIKKKINDNFNSVFSPINLRLDNKAQMKQDFSTSMVNEKSIIKSTYNQGCYEEEKTFKENGNSNINTHTNMNMNLKRKNQSYDMSNTSLNINNNLDKKYSENKHSTNSNNENNNNNKFNSGYHNINFPNNSMNIQENSKNKYSTSQNWNTSNKITTDLKPIDEITKSNEISKNNINSISKDPNNKIKFLKANPTPSNYKNTNEDIFLNGKYEIKNNVSSDYNSSNMNKTNLSSFKAKINKFTSHNFNENNQNNQNHQNQNSNIYNHNLKNNNYNFDKTLNMFNINHVNNEGDNSRIKIISVEKNDNNMRFKNVSSDIEYEPNVKTKEIENNLKSLKFQSQSQNNQVQNQSQKNVDEITSLKHSIKTSQNFNKNPKFNINNTINSNNLSNVTNIKLGNSKINFEKTNYMKSFFSPIKMNVNTKQFPNNNPINSSLKSGVINDGIIIDKRFNYVNSLMSSKSYGNILCFGYNTHNGTVRNYNEDRISIHLYIKKPNEFKGNWPEVHYFAVLDGHGGSKCVDFLKENLIKYIISNPNFPMKVEMAINQACYNAENDFINKFSTDTSKSRILDYSGSCVLFLLVINDDTYIVNIGDSRAIVIKNNFSEVVQLTTDHKPDNTEEYKRIVNNGGDTFR